MKSDFNPHTFLSTIGKGRDMMSFNKKDTIFAQGDPTDGLFFIQTGKVQLSVVSEVGKEATLGILSEDDFFGEGGLAGQLLRMSSATAMTDCLLLHIDKKAMILAMSGAKIVGHVCQIFIETKHPLSGRSGRSAFQFQ